MIPFMEEFHRGAPRQVQLGTLKLGDHAIILSLAFARALLIQVNEIDKYWIHGTILAPDSPPAGKDLPQPTFSRDAKTLCLPLSAAETQDLFEKYAPMFLPKIN
jgi:hypothetical protein